MHRRRPVRRARRPIAASRRRSTPGSSARCRVTTRPGCTRRRGPAVVRTSDHHRGPGARGRAAGLQRRAGGRRPAEGEPARDPQPAGPRRELQRRLIDFSSGLAYAVGGDACSRSTTRCSCSRRERRGLPGGEGAACRPRALPAPDAPVMSSCARSSRSTSSSSPARAVLSWFPVRAGHRARVDQLAPRRAHRAGPRAAAADHPAGRDVRPVVHGRVLRPLHPAQHRVLVLR